jgi:HK97 family phage portal protein
LILNVKGRGQIEARSFALTDMARFGFSDLRGGTATTVSESTARGVPALYRAARMRAEALATLRLRVWRGEGVKRERVDDNWQSRLFRDAPNPYQTRFGFWETVGESLAWRNNAYVWKNTDPQTERVIEMWALHPDQVKCKGGYKYEVEIRDGYVDPVARGKARYEVDEETILHIRGHGEGGTFEAPTPIKVFRDALESPIARQRHETRVWRKGTSMQVAVVFPEGVSKEQADEWAPSWRDDYTGVNGETTPMMGGGATIQPIGMTQADAAYVEMAKLTVHDASRIMGVPGNLLGVQMERAVPNLEQDLAMWLRFGLGPELERIESSLMSDGELFGAARLIYPGFDTEQFVRGDIQTEDNVAHQRVQDGRLLVDEWRASQGLAPLPGGAGKIPQIVPVGGGQNPNNGSTNGKAPAMNGAANE